MRFGHEDWVEDDEDAVSLGVRRPLLLSRQRVRPANDFRAATSQRFFSDRERPTSRTERMGDSESKEMFRRSWSRDSPSSREGFGGRGDSAQARADRFRRSLRNHQDGQQRSDDPALSQNAFAALGALDAALPDHAMAKNPSRREGAAEAKPRGLQNTSR